MHIKLILHFINNLEQFGIQYYQVETHVINLHLKWKSII